MTRVSETENQFVENFFREAYQDNDRDNTTHRDHAVLTASSDYATPSLLTGTTATTSASDGNDIITGVDDGTLNEDIRRMARALAPQMSELEDVLKDLSDTEKADLAGSSSQDASRSMLLDEDDEDDDLDDEMTQLAMSEQALREELEFAAGISLLGSPSKGVNPDRDNNENLPAPVVLNAPVEKHPRRDHASNIDAPAVYTLQDHADFLHLKTERVGGWYYSDMTSKLLPASSGLVVAEDLVKDYCLPVPFRKLKRIYGGLIFHDVVQHNTLTSFMTPNKSITQNNPSTPQRRSQSEGRVQTTASSLTPPPPPPPPPPRTLQAPQTPSQNDQPLAASQPSHNVEEPLPVRTVAIRVRPDVLCGAIMDAVHHAFEILPENCTTHILKRQGAHLRGAVYVPNKQIAYVVDIQLCTQKNDDLERRLIVRFYHIQDDPEALHELGQILQQQQQQVPPSPQLVEDILRANSTVPSVSTSTTGISSLSNSTYLASSVDTDVIAKEHSMANLHMKQACSLIQRLMAAQQQGGLQKMDMKQQRTWLGLRDVPFDSKAAMQYAIGNHLESNFKSCPSVREENKKASPTIRRLTLPSLSTKDWPMLEVSWILTGHIIEELDTRDCTFNTLATLPFGQFPSLPTLDVQYCSQLRRLSRENMITHLLKSAKDLEDYAGIAEYNCAVCITLLGPMLEYYRVPSPDLPKAKSLDEYPFEYAPPHLACPPWGSLVTEAMNQVAAKTPTGEIDVMDAVRLVYKAFTKQDDEEQGARLGRKNAQIMDRLANMQAHQRALTQNIRDSHVYSQLASESASAFLRRAQNAINVGQEGFPSMLQEEVPLLDFKISLGASQSGRCYVTSSQILFTTTYIPLVGSTRSTLFDLRKIGLATEPSPTSSLLNPFPNTMNVVLNSNQQVVYSFRPAIGPERLQTIISVIQSFADEATPSEYSQVVSDSQVVEEEGVVELAESQSEDQLSI